MNPDLPKSKFWKFALALTGVVFAGLILLVGLSEYQFRQDKEAVRRLAEGMAEWEKEEYARAMADTYGGTTPQETLRLYIEAVEKGDYELASKYLIESKRIEEARELKAVEDKGNIAEYLKIIETAQSEDNPESNSFRMKSVVEGGAMYIIDFSKYPNGIWKIIEI